ncbi:hypothetical protein LWI28_027767 [Acer negundo]|uniref:Uncharacterized protein n=1 Tax=Acer negundo TaxID=4023 RepID=A0AAD5IGM8_ACENE|nr:hypothetical protein LWI28_027767 [Acer negundo]
MVGTTVVRGAAANERWRHVECGRLVVAADRGSKQCRYPRRGGRLDLGGGGGFVVLDREDGKWGSTLFNSYRPLLEGVEIDLEEQPSIYSTWWEAGSMCKGGGYGREADDQGFGFWSGGERRGQRPLFLFVI